MYIYIFPGIVLVCLIISIVCIIDLSIICHLSVFILIIYLRQSSSIILLPTYLSMISINHVYLYLSIYLSIIYYLSSLSSSIYQSPVITINLLVICLIFLFSIYLPCDILINGTCSHTHTNHPNFDISFKLI